MIKPASRKALSHLKIGIIPLFLVVLHTGAVPARAAALYDQPGQGIFQCHDNGTIGATYTKGGGVLIRWDSLQPDNSQTVSQPALDDLANRIKKDGKKSYLHFQIFSPTGGAPGSDFWPLPDWTGIYDDDPSNDLFATIWDSHGVNPNIWDPEFRRLLQRFLTLVKQGLEARGALSSIEFMEPAIGIWNSTGAWWKDDDLGAWAVAAGCEETDMTCLGNRRSEAIDYLMGLHLTIFDNLPAMLIFESCRYSACNYNSLGNLIATYGMRIMLKTAGLGNPRDGSCGLRTYQFAPNCGSEAGINMTKCSYETNGVSVDCGGDNFDPAKTGCEEGYRGVYENSLARDRISYYCMYANDINCQSTANQFIADHVGAQIALTGTNIAPNQAKPGEPITISLGWVNTGSTPLTAPLKEGVRWTPSSYKLFVEFAKDGAVVNYQEVDLSSPTNTWLTTRLEGRYSTTTVATTPAVTAGTYQIYIGLTDPNKEGKRFALRNTDARNDLAHRHYLLVNSFNIAPTTPPATLPTKINPEGVPSTVPTLSNVAVALGSTPPQHVTFNRNGSSFDATIDFGIITPGTYSISIKSPLRLSRKIDNVTIVSGTNPLLDFTNKTLLGGDLDGDDQITMPDVEMLTNNYGTSSPNADINLDGQVNMADVGFLIKNWGQQGENR